MNYEEAKKRQGRTFRVKAGAFKGWEGTLQSITSTTGQLAFPGISDDYGKVDRLIFQYEDLELVTTA